MKTIYMLIISMTLAVGAVSLAESVERELKNDIVRLHIVADSDEKQAQELKLKVRDEIIKNVSLSDKDFVVKAENEAKRVLKENNENYGVKASFEGFYFPVKKYKNVTLPSGEYNSVRLVLGSGAGKNWWCIMYPPMCAVNDEEMELIEDSERLLKNNLNSESYELVTSKSDKVKLKFKTVEIIQYIKNMRKK